MPDRRAPVVVTLAAAVAIAVLPDLSHGPPEVLGYFLPVALGYACGAHAERWPGLAACVALAAGIQVNMGFSEFPNAEIAIGIFPPWWAGRQLRLRRGLVRALADRTRELEAEQESFVRLSVERERARIARDLHDIVSHHLAVMVIQAGAGRLAQPWDPEAATIRLSAIREAGEQALREADRLVTLLDAGADGARLGPLLDRARAGGAQVVVRPSPLGLTADVEAIACRIAQEALTNAMKHAPGAAPELRLETDGSVLTITVRNDLVAEHSALAATGSGLGLAGMEERVRALGGTLRAGPDGWGRFELRARLPLERASVVVA